MSGTFIAADGSKVFELAGMTDDKGRVSKSLPPGRIECVVKAPDGKPIDASTDVKERPEITDPVNIPEPVEINIIDRSTKLAYLSNTWECSRPILVLGDVSGSMSSGDRMSHLKSTLAHLYEECTSNGGRIALAVWNDNIRFCRETYLAEGDDATVTPWIDALQPSGGTTMGQAIRNGMAKFPDAKDVYVMCDGEVSSSDMTSSIELTKQYTQQGVRFHTVAFGEDAKHDDMQRMAEQCKGMFTSANKKHVEHKKFIEFESSHPYPDRQDEYKEISMPGAKELIITFDPKSKTESGYDYITFFKDSTKSSHWGEQKYSGTSWPGVNGVAPLHIAANHCLLYFHSDGSNR